MDKKKMIFNEKKFEAAVLYMLSRSPNATIEGKKKLAKLLYFADFNYFEAFEKPFTGATYKALPMGPVPQELEQTLANLEKSEITIKKKKTGLPNDTVVFVLKTDSKEKVDILSDEEKKVLDKVIDDYGKFNGKMLEDITHSEAPYNAVALGEHMPYELSFYRGKTMEELIGK
ncbi:MAG: Panacea domain-containing protein [Candidatus Paceibacterota bacterium]|jgi:uncharacterized phage-associated protein